MCLSRWCLCASRWKEALDAGVAPPVYLEGCHERALEYVTLEQLKQFALTTSDVAALEKNEGNTESSHEEL
jgi:hypothetical protein